MEDIDKSEKGIQMLKENTENREALSPEMRDELYREIDCLFLDIIAIIKGKNPSVTIAAVKRVLFYLTFENPGYTMMTLNYLGKMITELTDGLTGDKT